MQTNSGTWTGVVDGVLDPAFTHYLLVLLSPRAWLDCCQGMMQRHRYLRSLPSSAVKLTWDPAAARLTSSALSSCISRMTDEICQVLDVIGARPFAWHFHPTITSSDRMAAESDLDDMERESDRIRPNSRQPSSTMDHINDMEFPASHTSSASSTEGSCEDLACRDPLSVQWQDPPCLSIDLKAPPRMFSSISLASAGP